MQFILGIKSCFGKFFLGDDLGVFFGNYGIECSSILSMIDIEGEKWMEDDWKDDFFLSQGEKGG